VSIVSIIWSEDPAFPTLEKKQALDRYVSNRSILYKLEELKKKVEYEQQTLSFVMQYM
jgi:hypothetical protein